jgi:anti-anti-sigma factor
MEQEFALSSETRDNCLIITTSGYVNNTGGEAISREFAKHFGQGTKNIIINLGQSRVVNSIGMSHLIEIIEQVNEAEGKLVFTNLDPAVEKMLNIMGIFSFAGKEGSVEEALRKIASQ